MRSAIIYDFHGTLADVRGIRGLLADRNYDEFYRQSLTCPPIERVVQEAKNSHEDGFVNILFTGMPNIYADGLNDWLTQNSVPMDHIDMRRNGDWRKDFLVKRDMYLRVVDLGYYVHRAYEDSPRVVELWRSQGIEVDVIPGWDDGLVIGQVDKPPVAP